MRCLLVFAKMNPKGLICIPKNYIPRSDDFFWCPSTARNVQCVILPTKDRTIVFSFKVQKNVFLVSGLMSAVTYSTDCLLLTISEQFCALSRELRAR